MTNAALLSETAKRRTLRSLAEIRLPNR